MALLEVLPAPERNRDESAGHPKAGGAARRRPTTGCAPVRDGWPRSTLDAIRKAAREE